jgi:hypothetical protein
VAVGSVRDALVSSLISLPPSLLVIFAASFFGVKAVAASALLTLPFQAAVAIHFIGRHLDMTSSDLVRATFKSGIVALCSSAAAAVSAFMVDFGMVGQSLDWVWLVLPQPFVGLRVVTEHPLLPRLQLAATGFLFAISQFLWSCKTRLNPVAGKGIFPYSDDVKRPLEFSDVMFGYFIPTS